MGGSGSGRRWHYGAKDTTEHLRSIDVRRWKRKGWLEPGQLRALSWSRQDIVTATICVQTSESYVTLIYRHRSPGQEWKKENYRVHLDWTRSQQGGRRPWFLCPVPRCRRRVALLYGGAIFACRHCHNLTYASQREEQFDRAARKADRIREKLGWEQGMLHPKGWRKPKGMHWKTFEELNRNHDFLASTFLTGIASKLGMDRKLRDSWC
jgi:hypothetical protein